MLLASGGYGAAPFSARDSSPSEACTSGVQKTPSCANRAITASQTPNHFALILARRGLSPALRQGQGGSGRCKSLPEITRPHVLSDFSMRRRMLTWFAFRPNEVKPPPFLSCRGLGWGRGQGCRGAASGLTAAEPSSELLAVQLLGQQESTTVRPAAAPAGCQLWSRTFSC